MVVAKMRIVSLLVVTLACVISAHAQGNATNGKGAGHTCWHCGSIIVSTECMLLSTLLLSTLLTVVHVHNVRPHLLTRCCNVNVCM